MLQRRNNQLNLVISHQYRLKKRLENLCLSSSGSMAVLMFHAFSILKQEKIKS